MDFIKKFFSTHTITTHTVASVMTTLLSAYLLVPAFHDYVLFLYGLLPASAAKFLTVVFALYMWYRNGQTTDDKPVEPPVAVPPPSSGPNFV